MSLQEVVGGSSGFLPTAQVTPEARTEAEHNCGGKYLIGTYADGTNITWQLRESMQWARSQDAHCLKELAGSLVSQAPDTQFVLSRDTKSDCGFNHQAIGRLLVPVHILKAYGTDPVG